MTPVAPTLFQVVLLPESQGLLRVLLLRGRVDAHHLVIQFSCAEGSDQAQEQTPLAKKATCLCNICLSRAFY